VPDLRLNAGAHGLAVAQGLGRGLGLAHLDDWRGGVGRTGDLNSSSTRVLLSDDLAEGGEAYLQAQAALDYALMGIPGVDSLNRGPINDILRQLPKDHWKAGATPHPAFLIQTVVDEFNQRVMGGPYDSQSA
jgi:hypothetical protein